MACLAVLGVLLPLMAEAGEYRAPLLASPPVLDGRISPGEWELAVGIDGFAWQGQLDRRRARGYVAADARHLYLAVVSQLPVDGPLTTMVEQDTLKLVYDDSVEVWIDPTPGSEHGVTYQLIANSAGRTAYDQHARGNRADDAAWRGEWQVANRLADGWWTCEVAVPIAPLAADRPSPSAPWGINLCRNWKEPWGFSSLGGTSYAPTDRFVFTPGTPAIAVEISGDPFLGELDTAVTIHNPAAAAQSLKASILILRDQMPELRQEQTIEVAGDGQQMVTLKNADLPSERFEMTVDVTDLGGQPIYRRQVKWRRGKPWQWTTTAKEVLPIEVQFAHYPSTGKLRVRVDVRNLPDDATLQSVTCFVRATGQTARVAEARFAAFQNGVQEQTIDVPELDGSYELVAVATGEKVPEGELAQPFERQRFPWEGLGLGAARKVYPPFEPLTYQDHVLHAVLRDHTIGPAGLCDQIVAAGQPLLAGPMRLVVDGETATGRGPTLMTNGNGPDRLGYHSNVRAAGKPGLALSCAGLWEVDGLLQYDLALAPTGRQTVDSLTLVIPLRADQATHLHAMGDGIRNTLYEPVPAGDGVVWDASKVAVNDLPANFCSYLYVGTPVRGLCWFAENDAGWAWDSTKPNLDLVRDGETVTLRVHLVNQPTVIDTTRRITFGLLAAPVKPKLGDWRYQWRRGNYTLLGTDINWFALGNCGAVYPAQKDLELWRALAKANETEPTPDEIQAVIDRGMPYFQPYGEEYVERWVRHVRYNLQSRRGKRMVFYYNRASYQAAPEFQTFQDEWDLTDFRTVGPGNGVGEIKLIPSQSYIDHALYWYGKSFEVARNRGVYWDNYYLRPSYNTEMTAAYPKPDGSIMPATGIWGLRELVKRTFQYQNELGMTPITMAHMTSTAILPLLSFCTVQYDWEWKYSTGDVQYRFPRDYILLVSNGELAGTWPVLLGDHGEQASDPWTQRTFAGCTLVHELDGNGLPQVWQPLFKPIDAMLGRPNLKVWRYWDDRPQPVHADDPDLPTLVYGDPNQVALVLVVSYADEDRPCLLKVDFAALGLPAGSRWVDAETGQPATPDFTLKKHDLRLLWILPPGAEPPP